MDGGLEASHGLLLEDVAREKEEGGEDEDWGDGQFCWLIRERFMVLFTARTYQCPTKWSWKSGYW